MPDIVNIEQNEQLNEQQNESYPHAPLEQIIQREGGQQQLGGAAHRAPDLIAIRRQGIALRELGVATPFGRHIGFGFAHFDSPGDPALRQHSSLQHSLSAIGRDPASDKWFRGWEAGR